MPSWWDKLTGRPEAIPAPSAAPPPPSKTHDGTKPPPSPAKWLAPHAPGNPFGVPLLDLMQLQEIVSTSRDRENASRAVSWGASAGKELSAAALLPLPPIECELRYPAAESLPDGIRSRVVDVFDWLLRVHVWDQRLPLPVDDALADLLEKVPLSGFGPFGKALFCAAKSWDPPPPPGPLRWLEHPQSNRERDGHGGWALVEMRSCAVDDLGPRSR